MFPFGISKSDLTVHVGLSTRVIRNIPVLMSYTEDMEITCVFDTGYL